MHPQLNVDDIWFHIFCKFLSIEDLERIRFVNKDWHRRVRRFLPVLRCERQVQKIITYARENLFLSFNKSGFLQCPHLSFWLNVDSQGRVIELNAPNLTPLKVHRKDPFCRITILFTPYCIADGHFFSRAIPPTLDQPIAFRLQQYDLNVPNECIENVTQSAIHQLNELVVKYRAMAKTQKLDWFSKFFHQGRLGDV